MTAFIKEDIYAAARIIECGYDELVDALSRQLPQGFDIVPLHQNLATPNTLRCHYSEQGKRELLPRHPNLAGSFLGVSRRDPGMAKVLWDGMGTAQYLHMDFVKITNTN